MMNNQPDLLELEAAQKLLMDAFTPLGAETVDLELAPGRVLAEDILSPEAVPAFDRSPFDGYAFRAADTAGASAEHPVALAVTEEIPCGSVPTLPVGPGQAAKILTGAPIPRGADAVTKYEDTAFTAESVQIFSPFKSGKNIIRAGEDVSAGEKLAARGQTVTGPLLGALAAVGITRLPVHRRPRVAIISTGDELVPVSSGPQAGKIRDSSRYALTGMMENAGAVVHHPGNTGDRPEELADMLRAVLPEVDAVVTTGGVSVGDYDVTRDAVDMIGAKRLFWKVNYRPGGTMLVSEKGGVPILSLSGSPTAAALGMHLVALPVLRRLSGRLNPLPERIRVRLLDPIDKENPVRRLVRGRLRIVDGAACMETTGGQSVSVFTSMVGCDLIGDLPPGTPPLEAGAEIDAFWLRREDR